MATLRESGCGLGYGRVQSIDMTSKKSKAIIWKKAQERYITSDITNSTKTNSTDNRGKRKNESVDIFADIEDV